MFPAAIMIWLDRTEKILRGQLNSGDMPFLGLYSELFSVNSRENLRTEIHNTKNPFQTYLKGLERWPAVFSAYLTAYVVDGYGAEGTAAVWPYVSKAIVVGQRTLNQVEQEFLWRGYRRACIRLGLDVLPLGSVQNFRVAEFLHQAGVPNQYLGILTLRMLQHASHSGTPDADDPKLLVLWCNELLERLGPPVPITVVRAIEADQGGFYSRLFLSVLAGDGVDPTKPDGSLQARMAEIIAGLPPNQRLPRSQGFAIPRIVWRDDLLGVELPAGSTDKWRIDIDDHGNTYLGASEARFIPFEFPRLPGKVRISREDGHSSKLFEVWGDGRNNRLLVFDGDGSLAGGTCLKAGEPLHVEPGAVTLVLRFPPDGYESALIELCCEPRLYGMSCELAPGDQIRLQRGPAEVMILARSRPVLALNGHCFRGIGGNELYATTGLSLRGRIPVELLADGNAASFVVAIATTINAEIVELPIHASVDGAFELDLVPIIQRWQPGLARMRIELRRSGLRRSMARLAAWLWVGLTRIEDRVRFHYSKPPKNLDRDASDNLYLDEEQGVLTYRSDVKRFFRIVFSLDSRRVVQFTAAVPGAFMVLKRFHDGQVEELPLRKGAVLALRSDSREVVEVHSSQGGVLCLGRMRQEIPARAGLRRLHLSTLAEYLEPGTNILSIEYPQGLFESLLQVVTPHHVLAMSSREQGGLFLVKIDLPATADALRCTAWDMLTDKHLSLDLNCNCTEARLDRFTYGWLSCGVRQTNGSFRHVLEFPLERWPEGAWLLQVQARLKGHWGSLVNERDDIYAWGFMLDEKGAPTTRPWLLRQIKAFDDQTAIGIFKRVHQALLTCYAPDVWNGIRWLEDCWQQLAQSFTPNDGQLLTELLALDALNPPETSSASWFPLLMPGIALPWIYSAKVSAYRGISNRAGLIGEMSQIRPPLSGLFGQHYLEQTLAFGFENVMAMQRGAAPIGFSLVRYRTALAVRNIDDAWSQLSREDWRPSEGDYLGPVHWRYAFGSLVGRYRKTLMGNATRRGRAMHLVQMMRHLELGDLAQGLPAHLDGAGGLGLLITMPEGGTDQDQQNLQLIDRLLCLFAAVCRWESRGIVLTAWQNKLLEAANFDSLAVTQALSYLLYVGRDIFEFYLLLWELVFAADADTLP